MHWKEEAMHSEVVPSLLRMHTQLCIVLDARLRTFVACSTIYENLRFCANFSLRTLEGQASACVHACVQCSLHLSRWISVLPTVDWSAHLSSNTNGLWRSCEDPPEVCSEVPAETCFRPACFLIAWLNLVARKICVWVTVGDQRLVFLTIECICCTFLDFGCNDVLTITEAAKPSQQQARTVHYNIARLLEGISASQTFQSPCMHHATGEIIKTTHACSFHNTHFHTKVTIQRFMMNIFSIVVCLCSFSGIGKNRLASV